MAAVVLICGSRPAIAAMRDLARPGQRSSEARLWYRLHVPFSPRLWPIWLEPTSRALACRRKAWLPS
jgi:hypothetical protein